MTEILKGQLWQCGIGELRLEVSRANPDAIFNLAKPDDFYDWDSDCADKVSLYVKWPILDGDLPDTSHLTRLAKLGAELINDGQRLIVHCAAGHNRSGLLTAMIIRELQNVTGADAMTFLQEMRPLSLWNKQFVSYLTGLEQPFVDD